jgi:hypothetical protein
LVRASHVLDRVEVEADDASLVADAGLLLPATRGQRLGLAQLLDERVTAGAHTRPTVPDSDPLGAAG